MNYIKKVFVLLTVNVTNSRLEKGLVITGTIFIGIGAIVIRKPINKINPLLISENKSNKLEQQQIEFNTEKQKLEHELYSQHQENNTLKNEKKKLETELKSKEEKISILATQKRPYKRKCTFCI